MNRTRTAYVVVRTRFAAIHHWPDCDIEGKEYLKHPHRHEFHVEAWFHVTHNNRDIEFIRQKELLDDWLQNTWDRKDLGALSCEMMANCIINKFCANRVSVFEDGENGAIVWANGFDDVLLDGMEDLT